MKISLNLKRIVLFGFVLFCICGRAFAGKKRRSKLFNSPQSHNREIFSKTLCKFVYDGEIGSDKDYFIWECESDFPFTELILSWNSLRPNVGKMTFWVNVRYNNSWAGWQRLAEWGSHGQRTFVNKLNRYVHTKHVRVETQRGLFGSAFKVKVAFQRGADPKNLKALFVCLSNLKKFKECPYKSELPSVIINGVPRQSQMVLNHPRYRDLCSPTSAGILVNYFMKKFYGQCPRDLNDYLVDFADKVYDNGYLNIYGNWPLNVAQAYDATNGNVYFRVERLNSFDDLHGYLTKKVPVAVSVRQLAGGATSYSNGHLMVVVGWNKEKQVVLCIDPAFSKNSCTPKAYKLRSFVRAWGRSTHLSYIPIPRDQICELV